MTPDKDALQALLDKVEAMETPRRRWVKRKDVVREIKALIAEASE